MIEGTEQYVNVHKIQNYNPFRMSRFPSGSQTFFKAHYLTINQAKRSQNQSFNRKSPHYVIGGLSRGATALVT